MITWREIHPAAQIRNTQLLAGRSVYGKPSGLYPEGIRSQGAVNGVRYSPGSRALAFLRLAADVVEAQTVTIGPFNGPAGTGVTDVYEYDVINTDSAINTSGGEWNNTNNPIQVTMAAHGRSAGDLLRVENEIVKILRVISVNSVVVARGRSGTTTAAHADALDIFWSATPPTSNIPVGVVATLTPAVAGPALAAEINNILAGSERAASKASQAYTIFFATSLQAGAEVFLESLNPGARYNGIALAETLAGAGNAWDTAATRAGADAAAKKQLVVDRVPNAAEVLAGTMRFPVDFTALLPTVQVITTATGIAVGWVGARTYTAHGGGRVGGYVTLDNAGATDWAVTDTVHVVIDEA